MEGTARTARTAPGGYPGGMRITVGRLVTDPQVLSTLDVPPGQVAIETPEQLWENTRDADRLSQVATIPGMRITLGMPVTDPEVLALLGLPPVRSPWRRPKRCGRSRDD